MIMRYPFVDVLKALGIIAVVWIHSFLKLGEPRDEFCARLGFLTRFAVPAFFFVAGFLQAAGPRKSWLQFLKGKSFRLLVPYLVASLLAFVFSYFWDEKEYSIKNIVCALFVGSADGIYYFIPLLFLAMLVGFYVIPNRYLLNVVFVTFFMGGILSWLLFLAFREFFWEIRSPLHWWGFFFFGAVLGKNSESLAKINRVNRDIFGISLLIVAGIPFLIYTLFFSTDWSRPNVFLQYFMIYFILAGVTLLFWSRKLWMPLVWLSAATYPIYLYHRFFIKILENDFSTIIVFIGSLLCCILFVLITRRVFSRFSKIIFG
jgi:fucose 4-O-acetylase-like acetyltransferase